jgi:hypothetical protein
MIQAILGIKARPYSKNTKAKTTNSLAQVVECLPCKIKTLNLNPGAASPCKKIKRISTGGEA